MNYADAKSKVFANASITDGYNGDILRVGIARNKDETVIVTKHGCFDARPYTGSTDREAFETVKADARFWNVQPAPGHEYLGKPEPAGTEADPIRYEKIDPDDPDRKAKQQAQRDKSDKDAKEGKVIDLSDLMISHGM